MYKKLNEACDYIKKQYDKTPLLGVVLGSGLGVFAQRLQNQKVINYEEIPHFHPTGVEGHEGKLIFGEINGASIVAFQGRYHFYEGHSLDDVVLPVRILALLGARYLILTNASGGINRSYRPGELVCIKDHINMTGQNPLIGKNIEELGERFPDMTRTYTPELQELISSCAKSMGIEIKQGIYAGVLGPSYETPAEIEMLRTLGADLVGMSTVPEAIAANHAGLKIAGISCVTNMAAGIGGEKLTHEDVKLVAKKATEKFSDLLCSVIGEVGKKDRV